MSFTINSNLENIGINHTDPISEAGRKILRFHFLHMITHEPGSRQGEDIEELHNMRVASRRLRSAIGTFHKFYQKKYHKRFKSDLKDIGIALGKVRDIDVFLANLSQDQQILSQKFKLNLTDLKQYWIDERETARLNLNLKFDEDQYQEFLINFTRFTETSFLGVKKKILEETKPLNVRSTMPSLINSHFVRVQGIGYGVEHKSFAKLHKLRIEIKKLRYTLEFFFEILGNTSKQLVEHLKQIQDHLGKLNDAVVAVKMVEEFNDYLNRNSLADERKANNKYLQYKLAERNRLQHGFPDVWYQFKISAFEDDLRSSLERVEIQ